MCKHVIPIHTHPQRRGLLLSLNLLTRNGQVDSGVCEKKTRGLTIVHDGFPIDPKFSLPGDERCSQPDPLHHVGLPTLNSGGGGRRDHFLYTARGSMNVFPADAGPATQVAP